MTEQQVQATLAKSGAGSGASAGAPAAQTSPAPAQTAATSGEAPKKLPKTASQLPILGLAGLASLVVAVGFAARRRRVTR